METRVLLSNEKRVNDLLNSIQSERMTRTVDIAQIKDCVEEFTKFVGIPKTRLSCRFSFNAYAQRFPASYRHTPMATIIVIELVKGKPYIVNAYRGSCNKGHRYDVHLIDDSMKAAMIERIMAF